MSGYVGICLLAQFCMIEFSFSEKSLVIPSPSALFVIKCAAKLTIRQFTQSLHACIRHNQNLAGLKKIGVKSAHRTEKFISHDKAQI